MSYTDKSAPCTDKSAPCVVLRYLVHQQVGTSPFILINQYLVVKLLRNSKNEKICCIKKKITYILKMSYKQYVYTILLRMTRLSAAVSETDNGQMKNLKLHILLPIYNDWECLELLIQRM